MTTPPPESGLVEPWQVQRASGEMTIDEGRPFLKVPAAIDRIRLDDSGEWLPRVGEFTDHRRLDWHKFELPATAVSGHGQPAEQTISLTLFDQHDRAESLRVQLRHGLPRPGDTELPPAPDPDRDPEDAPAPSDEQLAPWRLAGQLAQTLTDFHLELVNRLHESAPRDPAMFWVSGTGGVGAWPLHRVLDLWRRIGQQHGPRPALIVSLAQRIGPTLNRVCHNPRRQLRRERRLQHAGRIRDMDATCIRWLARQPGNTVAEKAGARQHALGLARTESAATIENRVVADLLRRASDACDRYLDENADHPDDENVRSVIAFRGQLQRLRNESPVGRLDPPATVPRPNNVLLHDPGYRALWRAYAALLDQRRQRDRAWRWRHRLWAESTHLALAAALSRLQPVAPANRSSVLLRAEQSCGRFLDPRTGLGRWDLLDSAPPASLLLLDGRQFGQFHFAGMLPDGLLRLCPDAAILCRDPARPDKPPHRILAVWSVLDFDLDGDNLKDRCRRLDAALRVIPAPNPLQFHGLLLQPAMPHQQTPASGATNNSAASAVRTTSAGDGVPHLDPKDKVCNPAATADPEPVERVDFGCCRGLRLHPPIQPHEPTLAAELRHLLELSP